MKKQILLIDDDPIMNLINSKIVENIKPGAIIKSFKNGREALDHLYQDKEHYYFILLDINMPVMNGWQFLDQFKVRKDEFNTDIHILSSSIDESDRLKASEYSCVKSYLVKPLHEKMLTGILK